MLTTLVFSVTLLPVLPFSVGNIQLHALWDQSSLVVLAHVEKVERVRRELPEWASSGSRGPTKEVPPTSIAQLRILRTFRGPKDVRSILVPTDSSFICDVTKAVPGETAIFFLEGSRVVAAEGTAFCARLDEVFGEHEVLKIGFFGRGRMPVSGEGHLKCVESWTDVLFPEGLRPHTLPQERGFNHGDRAIPYDEFFRILETYRQVEEDLFLTANSTPGASGESGWSLALTNEGSCRLLVLDPDKSVGEVLRRGHEREYLLALDSARLRELRESIESERAWTLPSILGSMRPSPHQREMHFVQKRADSGSAEAGVLLFAIDEGWMTEHSRKESTLRALRIWSRIRGLIQDGTCADSRREDQAWLAAGR
jgi:hypothetical protein